MARWPTTPDKPPHMVRAAKICPGCFLLNYTAAKICTHCGVRFYWSIKDIRDREDVDSKTAQQMREAGYCG